MLIHDVPYSEGYRYNMIMYIISSSSMCGNSKFQLSNVNLTIFNQNFNMKLHLQQPQTPTNDPSLLFLPWWTLHIQTFHRLYIQMTIIPLIWNYS
jgi:hypothetical protein